MAGESSLFVVLVTLPLAHARRVITVNRKYFVLNIFRTQKLNADRTLYITLRMSTVGTATIDTHRTLEKERRDKLILLETGGSYMQNAHTQKYTVYIIICCQKNFVHLIFMGGATHKHFLTMKISRSTVPHDYS